MVKAEEKTCEHAMITHKIQSTPGAYWKLLVVHERFEGFPGKGGGEKTFHFSTTRTGDLHCDVILVCNLVSAS